MEKRVMGRPPAEWMYRAANLQGDFQSHYTFKELADLLGVCYGSIQKFCNQHQIDGKYMTNGKGGGITRLILFKAFQRTTKNYVNSYFKKTK